MEERDLKDKIEDLAERPVELMRKFILVVLGSVVVMWGLNIAGLQYVNLFIGMAGLLVILSAMVNPKMIAGGGAIGGLIAMLVDSDKSQGVFKGIEWMYRATMAAGLGFLFASFTLATWDFSTNPFQFWVIFVGVLILILIEQVYRTNSQMAKSFIGFYSVCAILIAGWNTFEDDSFPKSWVASWNEEEVVQPVTPDPHKLRCNGEFASKRNCHIISMTEGSKRALAKENGWCWSWPNQGNAMVVRESKQDPYIRFEARKDVEFRAWQISINDPECG